DVDVRELVEEVADAVESGGALVVGGDDVPGWLLDVGVLERRVLRHRVADVELVLGQVHVGELPALEGLGVAGLEALALLVVRHREPVLEHGDPRPHQHPLELRAAAQELLVLLLGAVAHHPLDVRAVVPAAVEQDHLTGSREVLDVALEVPLGALALARLGQRDHADRARAGALGDPLDDAALAGRAPALEDHQHLEPLGLYPVLQQPELFLEPLHLRLVDRGPEPAPARVVVRVAARGNEAHVVGPLRQIHVVGHRASLGLADRPARGETWQRRASFAAWELAEKPPATPRPSSPRASCSRWTPTATSSTARSRRSTATVAGSGWRAPRSTPAAGDSRATSARSWARAARSP